MTRSADVTVVVPTVSTGAGLAQLLDSLATQTLVARVIVVDNGTPDDNVAQLVRRYEGVEHLRLPGNAGFGRAVNRAVESASGDAIVVLNDDCVCEPQFVEQLAEALDSERGLVMAAGILLDADEPSLIDTAGIVLDETLFAHSYLEGELASSLDPGDPPPFGPCGGAAAYDRETFLRAGGFDEHLFAYWEDVDLAVRIRLAGGRCALAVRARAVHSHSSTLGYGSRKKDAFVGFGRGYLLAKWSILESRHRAARVATQEAAILLGQLLLDGTAVGLRARIAGYRSAHLRQPYPAPVLAGLRGPHGWASRRVRSGLRHRVLRKAPHQAP